MGLTATERYSYNPICCNPVKKIYKYKKIKTYYSGWKDNLV